MGGEEWLYPKEEYAEECVDWRKGKGSGGGAEGEGRGGEGEGEGRGSVGVALNPQLPKEYTIAMTKHSGSFIAGGYCVT